MIESENGSGTGFFVAPDKIATNIQAVAHAGPIFVKSPDKEKNWAVDGVIAFDAENNLVLLKLAGEGVPLPLEDSDTAQIGDFVSIPVYPDGELKVTAGSIQSIRNSNKWLRIKAAISKETNGSPVLNNNGQVIAVIVPYGLGSYSYAISSSALEALLDKSVPIEPLAEWRKRKQVRAESYYSLGEEKSDAEDYAGAIVDFDKAIELNPRYVRAYYERGRAQAYLGDYASGIASCTRAIRADPKDADPYYSRGSIKAQLGEYTEAVVDLDKAIKLDARHANAYGNRGSVKIKLGESEIARRNAMAARRLYGAAIADCDKAIQIDPEYADAYNNRGLGQIFLGKSETARGNTKAGQRLYEAAIADCDKAIQIDPEYVDAHNNRGLGQFLLGKSETARGDTKAGQRLYEAAIADCDKAIQMDPEYANAYNNRGLVKSDFSKLESIRGNVKKAQDLYDASIADCTQSININPKYVDAYKMRATVKCRFGDIESARGDPEKAQQLYHDGITDLAKSIQLDSPENTDVRTTDSEFKIPRDSTVHIMGWTGTSSNFFAGSGFFVDKDKIVTNIHVVAWTGPVFAKLSDTGTIYAIEGVTAFDVENDLVILKLVGEGTPLLLGDSDAIQSAESVVSIGYPNNQYEVGQGTIHSIRKSDNWIRIKIDIDIGSSGGPVLNGDGQVIGIHAVKHVDYSYAIPSNALKALLAQSKPTQPLIEWRKRKHILAYAYHVQGLAKFIAMNFREALTNYDKAIKLNPENIYTYCQRGNVKAALGKYKKAMADYDKAIKLNPEDLSVYYLRGNVKIAFDKREEAVVDFDKIIRLNPDDADAYSSRGEIRFRLGVAEFSRGNVEKAQELYEAAIEDYTQAIKLNPEDTEVISKRGAVKSALTAMRKR